MKNNIFALAVCFMAVSLCCTGILQAQNLERKAKRGNVQAQFELAKQYYSGIGQLKNYKQAFVWFDKAAKGGSVDAMYQVATMLEEGKGRDTNVRNAFNNYLKAAERGNIPSQMKVAVMYEQGRGVVKSEARAYLWYRVCAERNNIMACRKLGDYYMEGRVVDKDHSEAKFWYEKALNDNGKANIPADKADVIPVNYEEMLGETILAMTNLAHLYMADEGIAPDAEKAKGLLEKANALRKTQAKQ